MFLRPTTALVVTSLIVLSAGRGGASQSMASVPPQVESQTQPPRAANANLEDFDFVTEKIRLNYAGWDTKVTDETRPRLAELTARLRAEAADATPVRLGEILNEWLKFFRDGHVGIAPIAPEAIAAENSVENSAGNGPTTPVIDWTEASVRARLDAIGPARDPLEGVWRIAGDRYRVGVLRTPGSASSFSAVVLTTTADGWKPGHVKAELTRAADGSISALFRAGDHSEHRLTPSLVLDGIALDAGKWGAWVREYPVVPDAGLVDRAIPSGELFLRPLSGTTMWLRLPDFDASRAQPLEQLLAAHERELASFPNLVIDARDNGGGFDSVYAPIFPLFYTRPIYTVGIEIRATKDNIACLKLLADELRANSPDIAAGVERRIARLERDIGGFVQNGDRPFSIKRLDAVRAFPKRVAILIDGAGSSGEQFLLEARQSRKVTLFGKTNSRGVLDFANIVGMKTPSGRHQLFWATSRTLRLPDEPVDPDGIAPDIRIPAEIGDPVGFAQAWLERQVD